MKRAGIFNYLDEERKVLGFSILEIVVTVVTCLAGFILQMVGVAVLGMFFTVIVMRYIKGMLKKTGFMKIVFFWASDMKKEIKYQGKYYL